MALRTGGWDQDRLDAKAQADTEHPGEIAGRGSPAHPFAGIVELDLSRQAQRLPALAQEVENNLRFAGAVEFQANGTLEGIYADEDVVPLPVALQVDRADAVNLMELIGLVGGWRRVSWVGNEGGQPHFGNADAIALEHPFDGPQAGQWPKVQGV